MQMFNLPPLVDNSQLIPKKVSSAKDSLAAATFTTGASLPLMIGGRSKCIVNNISSSSSSNSEREQVEIIQEISRDQHQQQKDQHSKSNSIIISAGPKNTALRAEQRRQNMVSIVRPTVNLNQNNCIEYINQKSNFIENRKRLEESSIWEEALANSKNSIIEEFMNLEYKVKSRPTSIECSDRTTDQYFGINKNNHWIFNNSNNNNNNNRQINYDELSLLTNKLDNLNFSNNDNNPINFHNQNQQLQFNEQQARQQMLIYRREEYELNKGIRKQHRFIMTKIEERKRNLLIIQSVWYQKDFKHAIEKLVDIYHQGLIFSYATNKLTNDNSIDINNTKCSINNNINTTSNLDSLNSSLVVDVIGIIILRPQLWSLEICQLLLPIIVNDLLVQNKSQRYENYIEVSLKALKLILTHFSSVIISTLDSQKDSTKLIGVDLSREDRINKCLNCYKLLLEAKTIIAKRCSKSINNSKLCSMYKELHQSFISLQASFDQSNPITLFKRTQE